jgi:hypothetical protein
LEKSGIIKELLSDFETISLSEARKYDLNQRFDAKFLLPIPILSQEIKNLKSFFLLQINESGQSLSKYETDYWDTEDMVFFGDHAKGRNKRMKVRKRLYTDTGDCFIEIKIKAKGKTDKIRQPSSLPQGVFTNEDKLFLRQNNIDPETLRKTLSVIYSRITLWSTEREGRITIDFNLEVSHEKERDIFENVGIIEIKGSRHFHTKMLKLFETPLLRYKTSMSKYANGVIHLNDYDSTTSKLLHPVYKNLLKINTIEQ